MPEIRSDLKSLLHMSLWANRKDLSLSTGEVDKSELNLESLSKNLLIDNTEEVLKILKKSKSVAFILDNCGWEFFSDIQLAKHLNKNFDTKICFYPKHIPWFISDVTDEDIKRLSPEIDFEFETKSHEFWTSDKAFCEMPEGLKNELSEYDCVFFKGDLNYRKLVGDLAWPIGGDDDLDSVLKKLGFNLSTNLIVLRTLKA